MVHIKEKSTNRACRYAGRLWDLARPTLEEVLFCP